MKPLKYYYAILVYLAYLESIQADIPSCNSKIYCQGELLKTVQTARIFSDSKTFVDMEMKYAEAEVWKNFNSLMNRCNRKPPREEIRRFVYDNFQPGNELEMWTAPDFNPNPPFLKTITNDAYRNFAKNLVQLWSNFSRILKPNVFEESERYSIIPVSNGFVVPGGRFREFYYWDSYWIMKGLLISGMHQTVRGMLDNFLSMVDRFGFVPNGGRIYYLNRSQPPLLNLMVDDYIKATNDIPWLKKNLHLLQKELKYWLKTQTITLMLDGVGYRLAHYAVESPSPRPESFYEDIKTCSSRPDEEGVKNCYKDLKSGAETGWDFSSRWLFNEDGSPSKKLTTIQTRRVIPVDLNAFLAQAFGLVAKFSEIVGDSDSRSYWTMLSDEWKKNILKVLFHDTDRTWYDFDTELMKHRKIFYPSNLAPLWCKLYNDPLYGDLAVAYLEKHGVLKFAAGIPTSLLETGEQWDFPNAWPPLQSLVILGLKRSGSDIALKTSEKLAKKWLENNLLIYNRSGFMYEKYNAESIGVIGGGGEYSVQTGFGWSNGEVFELIDEFYSDRSQ